jgi:hypothetical protein
MSRLSICLGVKSQRVEGLTLVLKSKHLKPYAATHK